LALSGGTASITQQSFTVGQTDVPGNPKFFLRLAVTTGDNSCRTETLQEDATTFAGQTVTISFWAKGTNPAGGSLEVFFRQEFGSGGSTAVATSGGSITLTSSWQRFTKTVAVPSVSGKTIGTGSSWGVDIRQPAADTGVAAWTLDLSNVQVESGSTASPFQTATGTLQGELAACQRYYFRANWDAAALYAIFAQGGAATTTTGGGTMYYPVQMRVKPTAIDFPTVGTFFQFVDANGTSVALTGLGFDATQTSTTTGFLNTTVASGLTQFRPYVIRGNNSTGAYLGWSAEL
jgi:hypothetical protein